MKKFKKLNEKNVHIKDNLSGYDKKIVIKTFRLPNGIIENFFIEKGSDSVQILALTKENKFITVQQFRPGSENFEIELPGGGIEPGEDLYRAAERELKEETGFIGNMEYVCSVPYSPYSTGKKHIFVAGDCMRIDNLELDENEFLRVVIWPIEKVDSLLSSGKLRGVDSVFMGLKKINKLDLLS